MFRQSLACLLLLLPAALFARDINLDELYFRKDSLRAQRLAIQKLDAYQSVQAHLVDSNVIFAGWLSGPELFYIQEVPGLAGNILFQYNAYRQRRAERTRIPGIITAVRTSPDGSFLALKRLIRKEDVVPSGETVIYSFRTGKTSILPTATGFLDFDIPSGEPAIVYEAPAGITEYHPDTGRTRLLIEKRRYADIAVPGGTTMALLSPDRRNTLVLCGGGGSYAARLYGGRTSFPIPGISSASETFWVDAHTIAFRSGAPGSYSVRLYDVRNKTVVTLLSSSLNTSLSYSPHAATLSFLNDQVICLYAVHDGKTLITGIEGEDVSLSASGSRFISLFNRRLFIVNIELMKKNEILLRRSWASLLASYRELSLDRRYWENEYSLDYIRRKIRLYSSLIDG
ncbi:MAG TPA: hypothetical protein VLM75_07155 [Spirochaetota bacterium]|nr:hypothetical protein [Spirochaetota bacterium]